ncbi:ethanolamine utilization protein EutH [Clostridium amazonitimonense]|uniref:ethanolamine utilization protein EutH n=1 Tax=Clostridium amazonitimonense TaxID=1499689 RepID=UPI000509F934|nr:ethanolamine utilization protein EutH [Clostridium amazonitimonense]
MDKIVLTAIAFFFLFGGIDFALGNRLKVGEKFEEGLKTMGSLAIAIVGIYSLSPLFSEVLSYIVNPIANVFSLDPSLFPAMVLAPDMGAYALANGLAFDNDMALFSSVILASMLGTTISFTIPMAISMVEKEDEIYFSKGILAGVITIPIGCLVGGLIQGINIAKLLWNIMPIILFSIFLSLGLIKIPEKLIRLFSVLGKIIVGIGMFGLIVQGIDVILGIKLIKGLIPPEESIAVAGKIAFILGGAYPMISVLSRIFKEPFRRFGKRFGLDSVSVVAFLGSLASNLLVFASFKEMNIKGKILCTAFSVSGAFVFGGQMGFISAKEPDALGVFIISKLVAGISSMIVANILFKKDFIELGEEN